MADDPTRRKTARDKSELDSDERSKLDRFDGSEARDGADERRDSKASATATSNHGAALAADVEQPSKAPKTGTSSGRGTARSRRGRSTRLTEEQIDTPKRQTLILLGIVSVLTVALWVAAKAACNMHTQVTRPRKVAVEQIVRTPKHAAIELQQRWAKGDFTGAQKLASAAVAAELETEKNACDASCVSARHSAAERTLSTAYVIDRDANASRVWVRTVGMPQGEQNYVLEVVRDQATKEWEIVGRRSALPGEKPVRPAPPPAAAQSAELRSDPGSADAALASADASGRPATPASSALSSGRPATVASAASAPANSPLPATSVSR